MIITENVSLTFGNIQMHTDAEHARTILSIVVLYPRAIGFMKSIGTLHIKDKTFFLWFQLHSSCLS